MTTPEKTPVTEVVGEDAEGAVLQALAGEGSMYVMVIFAFEEGEEGEELNIRIPSNVSTSIIKSMLARVLQELE